MWLVLDFYGTCDGFILFGLCSAHVSLCVTYSQGRWVRMADWVPTSSRRCISGGTETLFGWGKFCHPISIMHDGEDWYFEPCRSLDNQKPECIMIQGGKIHICCSRSRSSTSASTSRSTGSSRLSCNSTLSLAWPGPRVRTNARRPRLAQRQPDQRARW
jgi:hypothetical protein